MEKLKDPVSFLFSWKLLQGKIQKKGRQQEKVIERVKRECIIILEEKKYHT
jgi:hypothetical protein